MFNSSKKSTMDNQKIDTIIGPSSSLEGEINASGTIRIDGKYKGDIHTNSSVIIGEQGCVNGNIFSASVYISGKVEGNISCSGLLEILSAGKLIGDIEVKNISINDGAVFKGKCNMISSDKTTLEETE